MKEKTEKAMADGLFKFSKNEEVTQLSNKLREVLNGKYVVRDCTVKVNNISEGGLNVIMNDDQIVASK